MTDTIDIGRKKRAEILFFALFIPWISLCIVSETTLTYTFSEVADYVVWLLKSIILPVCLVLLNLFSISKSVLRKKLLILAAVVLLTAQCFMLTYSDDLLLCVCLMIAVMNIDFKKVLKVYLLTSLSLLILMTIASATGLISNIVSHRYGDTRYGLGAFWCTDYSSRIFFLLLIALYLYSAKMKLLHWLGLVASVLLVYHFTVGKMDLICMMLALLLFFTNEMILDSRKSFGIKTKWPRIWGKLAPFFTPVSAVLITSLTLLYSLKSKILLDLNNILSDRLLYGNRAFSEIGITPLGKYVKWIGMGGISDDILPEGYNFVDASYLNVLFSFGIIAAIAVIVLQSYIAYHHRRDTRLVIAIALISIQCILSHHFIDIAYNPFWVVFLAKREYIANTEKPSDPALSPSDIIGTNLRKGE
ncbi:MAG: hypothetical protein J6Y58_03830 [Clostridiales bacterium]|nr:hypothetical protein [Clostridiales bacterium]